MPDAFNMKSEESCLHLVKNTIGCGMKFTMFLREKYLGKKIDSFKAGAGTVLFLYDEATVKKMQEQFSTSADNFLFGQIRQTGCCSLLFGLC